MMFSRSNNPQNHWDRDVDPPAIRVGDHNVIHSDYRDRSNHHLAAGEGESDIRLCRRILVEKGLEGLGPIHTRLIRWSGGEDRPGSHVEPDIAGLIRAVDSCVIDTGADDDSAKTVTAELDRHPLAAVSEILRDVGELEFSLAEKLAQFLVLGRFISPLTPGALAKLSSQVWIGIGVGVHVFSRSRHRVLYTG